MDHGRTTMPPKPTYEELENRIDTLERLLGVASLDGHAETARVGFDDTVPEAASDAKTMDLASIVDAGAIQALMDDFFKLTRIGVAILDMKGNVLVATGWQDICVDFHRLHSETARNCLESDLKLSNGVAPGTFRLYRCKNNMWDMATPILAGNRKVGNLFLGQFLFEDEEPNVEVFRNQARTYGFDETAYIEALRRVPRWSRGTVETVMAFYTKLAHLISELGYRNLLLQKSEEKFRNLFESSFEGIAESDLQGRLVSCNSAYARMTGYTQDELKRLRYQDLTPPKWADIDKGHIRQCLERGYSDIYEKERIRKDGETIPVSMRIWLRKDAQGKPVGFWGIVQDISDRKQSENALRESESRFRSFVENANDIVYALSPEGTFTYVSPNWFEFMGEPAEAAVGQSFEPYVHPEDVRLCRRFLEKVLGTREKQSRLEYRVKHRDGSWRWHVSNGSPIGGADGKIAGYMGIARDVTERKTAETALNESRQMFQSIVDNIGTGVALISPNMEILALNRQMKKWFPEIDVATRPICYRAFNNPPRDEICEYCPSVKTLRDGRIHEDTTRTPRGDAAVHYRIVSSPIRDASDRVTAVIEMVEDVTEEIRLARHISQVQKMESIGNLAAGIAHDFNNILSPILGMSEMLLEDLPAGGMAHQNVREIFDAGKRAQELVRQILTFSRQSEHKTIPVGIQKILREVLRLCRRTIPSDIEISFDVQNDCGLVRADPTHIHQVCMNLITNAYHAVENNGGKIAVSLHEEDVAGGVASEGGLASGRHAVLTVSDTGGGDRSRHRR